MNKYKQNNKKNQNYCHSKERLIFYYASVVQMNSSTKLTNLLNETELTETGTMF